MKEFGVVHRKICLKVICQDEYENIIKQHFWGNANIIYNLLEEPTYTLIVSNKLSSPKGVYHKMVDKWFNYSTLDCWIDNSRKICQISNFYADTNKNRNLTIQYFVSNLFNRLLEIYGYTAIHSSCVEKSGKGIAFIGDRLSGKTTCMLNLLHCGFNFISNDCSAIKYLDEKQYIDIFGIANDIFIRMSQPFCTQPENEKYLKIAEEQNVRCDQAIELENNRIVMTPFELVQMNNVQILPSTNLRLIIIPRYNPKIKKAKFTMFDSKSCNSLFRSQAISLVHDTTAFLKDVMILGEEKNSLDRNIAYLTKVPCYLCEQNENTMQSFVDKINLLL